MHRKKIMVVEVKERTDGVGLSSDRKKNIPFVRWHVEGMYQEKKFVFYVYQHQKTGFWFVFWQPYDTCLAGVRWSTSLSGAFQKHRKVFNLRGINDEYILRFHVSEEIVEQIKEALHGAKNKEQRTKNKEQS